MIQRHGVITVSTEDMSIYKFYRNVCIGCIA